MSYEIKLLEVVARLGAPRVGIGSPRTCVQASPRVLRKPPGSGQSAPSCSDEPAGTTRGPQAPVPSRLEMRPHPQLRPFPLLDPAPTAARSPTGLPHLALVALLFGAEVDRRQAGQVEGASRARAWDRP